MKEKIKKVELSPIPFKFHDKVSHDPYICKSSNLFSYDIVLYTSRQRFVICPTHMDCDKQMTLYIPHFCIRFMLPNLAFCEVLYMLSFFFFGYGIYCFSTNYVLIINPLENTYSFFPLRNKHSIIRILNLFYGTEIFWMFLTIAKM